MNRGHCERALTVMGLRLFSVIDGGVMGERIHKIWNIATTLLVIVALILAVLVVGVRLVGIQPFIVLSGSMEPKIHTGAMVYVREADPAELAVGDIITFRLSGDVPATHRIIEVTDEGFITKGDANEYADNNVVQAENIVGKYIFNVPYLGFAVSFVQQPPGTYAAIAIASAFGLLLVLPDMIWGEKKKEKIKK